MNKTLLEDFKFISDYNIDFEKFRDKSVLVTGATGLLGSLLVKSLLYCNEKHNLNLTIVAAVRNKEKTNRIYNNYSCNRNLKFYYFDLINDDINISENIDFVFHTASITSSKEMINTPVETIKTAVMGTSKILDFAVKKNVSSVVYLSSMEMYGIQNNDDMTTEDELGFVDLFNVRSCYPESKRMCECMCTAYASQHSLNVKIARLAQTFGAGILENETRIFAQFAKSVMKKKDIVLHTEGKSEGNYVYIRDAITALLLILLNGSKGEAYNIANEESHTTIKGMAEIVAKEVADNNIKVIIDIPEKNMGYAPDTKLFLSSDKLKELGWAPSVSLTESYKRMIEYMKEESYKTNKGEIQNV